jgi:hypothetical protein
MDHGRARARRLSAPATFRVMAGLVPAIHAFDSFVV